MFVPVSSSYHFPNDYLFFFFFPLIRAWCYGHGVFIYGCMLQRAQPCQFLWVFFFLFFVVVVGGGGRPVIASIAILWIFPPTSSAGTDKDKVVAMTGM